jgi:hypothetical protein
MTFHFGLSGKPYMTGVLKQYLDIATAGNVVADYAVVTCRWRLRCRRCDGTLTFVENYDLDEEYTKHGRLDAGVQQFAQEHQHKKSKPATCDADMGDMKKVIGSPPSTIVRTGSEKKKTEGRKFR